MLPNDTDLTPALQTSVIAYNFAFIGRSGLYHSPKATPENLDQGALQDMGAQVLGLTRALLDAPKLPEPAPDVVFADVFGLMLLIYPTWLGWGMLAVTGLSLAVLVRHEPDFRGMGYGALRLTGFLILSACLVFGLNIASGSAAAWSNGYDRLAAIPLLEAMTLLGMTGAALLVFGRGIGSTSA